MSNSQFILALLMTDVKGKIHLGNKQTAFGNAAHIYGSISVCVCMCEGGGGWRGFGGILSYFQQSDRICRLLSRWLRENERLETDRADYGSGLHHSNGKH